MPRRKGPAYHSWTFSAPTQPLLATLDQTEIPYFVVRTPGWANLEKGIAAQLQNIPDAAADFHPFRPRSRPVGGPPRCHDRFVNHSDEEEDIGSV
jgi:hypothetical protein